MTLIVPDWEPPWPSTGGPTFVRVSSSHLKDPDWLCPEQMAKKARPEVWPAARGDYIPRPPATFALGLLRDAAIDLLSSREPSAVEAVTAIQLAVQARVDAAKDEWVEESVELAVRGLGGYLRVLARLREEGVLARTVVVADLVVVDEQEDHPPVESVTWAVHHLSVDGSLCETHVLRLGSAGDVRLAPAEVALMARVAAEGFIAEPKDVSGWSSPHRRAASQPPAPRNARVRVVGVLDDSDRMVFDGTADVAATLVADEVPAALAILAGGRFRAGRGCADCALRQHCPGLPERAGLLGVAGYSTSTRSLSPSDLTKHALCPKQLHLLRDLGMPAQIPSPSGPLRRGQQVHEWLAAAHQRGVACRDEDLPLPSADMVGPGVVRAAGIATDLGWGYDEYVTNRHFLLGHLDQCPWHRGGLVSLTHEVPMAAWDTDANVVISTRSDVVYVTDEAEVVVRETKTVSPRFVAPDPGALLHQFPQLALSVCLMADGHPALEQVPPGPRTVELEILGAAGHRLERYDAMDPATVLAARTALADRVDRWLHDTTHLPGPRPPCQTCPVTRFCSDYQPQRGLEVPADLLLGLVDPGAVGWGSVDADEVSALVDLDPSAPADDIPF
jgi:hypothetical protein